MNTYTMFNTTEGQERGAYLTALARKGGTSITMLPAAE